MIGKTISHYKILEELGHGGMGTVYKAKDTKLDRFVALKFLPPHLSQDEEGKKRFIHEAKAASALDHPNIYAIYEIDETEPAPGEPGGQMFIAMACYEGESLKEKIERGPLPLDRALDIAIQTAQGLVKAHKRGIIHRDIKPANILITEDDAVKIVDFGLAKLSGRTMITKTGTTMGTIAYMSPEQAQGAGVDQRTDIWSFGVMLYEMVTGQSPFKGDYEQAVIYSILNEEPTPMTGLRDGVPMGLDRLVTKTLAKNPGERHEHMHEMVIDLKAIRKDLESRTKPAPPVKAKLPGKTKAFLYGGITSLLILTIVVLMHLFSGRDEEIDSLAVLPLENLMGDPEQEYFVDGMTEALITELSKISALKVISRTSAMQYKELTMRVPQIARELNVDALIEGSVLREGDRVRVTVQLIHGRSDRHLWAQSFDRELSGILALHSDVAKAVAKEIRVKLSPTEQARLAAAHPINPVAHEAYLKGIYHWNKMTWDGYLQSLEYFEQAIRIDPDYAQAYAEMARVYGVLGAFGGSDPQQVHPKAKEAALKALELDNTLAQAHVALGSAKMLLDWDWAGAERELKRALELNPNVGEAYGIYLARTGRHQEAIAEMKRARERDPLSLRINATLAWTLYLGRQYDQALEQSRNTLELNPNYPLAHWIMGLLYERRGMLDQAIGELQKAADFSGKSPFFRAWLAYGYAVAGKEQEARKHLAELTASPEPVYVQPTALALIHVGLGEKEQAFAWLEKAYEIRDSELVWIRVFPQFAPLRDDPRLQDLLLRLNLPSTGAE